MLVSMAQAFDTLAAGKRLRDAGMKQEQAEAVAAAVREGQGDLVTKADLRAELAGLERRMILFALALVGALFAAIKLVP